MLGRNVVGRPENASPAGPKEKGLGDRGRGVDQSLDCSPSLSIKTSVQRCQPTRRSKIAPLFALPIDSDETLLLDRVRRPLRASPQSTPWPGRDDGLGESVRTRWRCNGSMEKAIRTEVDSRPSTGWSIAPTANSGVNFPHAPGRPFRGEADRHCRTGRIGYRWRHGGRASRFDEQNGQDQGGGESGDPDRGFGNRRDGGHRCGSDQACDCTHPIPIFGAFGCQPKSDPMTLIATDPRRRSSLRGHQPGIHQRSGPLLRALRDARSANRSCTSSGMRWRSAAARSGSAGGLGRTRCLRAGLRGGRPRCLLDPLFLAVHDLLVIERGWTSDKYRDWLAKALQEALLPG